MTVYGIKVTFRAFKSGFVQWLYTLLILNSLVLLMVSLWKTYTYEAGRVSPALLEKIKSQFLKPKQKEKVESIRGDMNQRAYLLKYLNQAVAKHVTGSPSSDLNEYSYNNVSTDMELLDLQPTTTIESSRGTNISKTVAALPNVCKFTYCEACNQIKPPRSEHCESCN